MRVIAGEWRGRLLRAPAGRDVRPTSDRVREALFSILGPVEGLAVLDLFAGSGALAFEALSRGASEATLVDLSPAAITAISRNITSFGTVAEVHRMPALTFLGRARADRRQYDLVFVDPPYRQASELGPVLSAALPAVLAPGARVVAESDRRAPLNLDLPLLTERRYGDTLISIHDT
jgi:16S rRNA (guanine(966)-N(2))-methyltransferase RsmD